MGLVLRYMVHRTSTVCQRLTIILYVIFTDWLVPKCSSKLDQLELFEVLLDIVVQGTMSSSNMVDAVGVEPTVPQGGRFTVFWGYQFSYTSILLNTLLPMCILKQTD